MATLDTIISEIERQISNPSPAMVAYLEASRMHAENAADIEVPFEVWESSLETRNAARDKLSPGEITAIDAIIRATL